MAMHEPGPGEVVISTFADPATHELLNLATGGEYSSDQETIGVTATHAFGNVLGTGEPSLIRQQSPQK